MRELLQQALDVIKDATQQIEAEWIHDYEAGREAIAKLEAELVKPEQEPVAWMENSVELYVNDRPTSIYTIPLYTTPPKREWQGLTDEEIKNVWQEIKDAVCLDHQTFARAIEAKLREKNNGN